jgi:NodT family efflux transporter outer membrane factor (OMF) lipoprotein
VLTTHVPRRSAPAAALAGLLLLAACAVGPDFVRPPSPEPASYTAEPTPAILAPGAGGPQRQRLRLAQDLSARWWELFRSPPLDAVLTRALDDSPSLAAARATLAQAREAVTAARGSLLPQVDAAASADRTRSPALRSGIPSSTAELYSVGLSASYLVDVFGGTRRTVEQQAALADVQSYELAAAWLSLTGNAATRAIEIASVRAEIAAIQAVIADDEHNLELVQDTFAAGKATRADVLVAETQLATDRTQLPALRQRLAVARHALSALAGQVPAAWTPPAFDLDDFALPGELPLSLPSELARQRPDIRAAEAKLHAASAAIGVATAALYPQLTLSGSFSREALTIGALSSGAGTAWTVAGALATPVFHGGTLRAERRAAIDAYEASLATYRETVLAAFQQVADALRALEHDAALVGAAEQLLDTATESLELQRVSYQAGKTDLLRLIDAERAMQQARSGLAVARGQRLQDTVQLFVALGGGWWQAGL